MKLCKVVVQIESRVLRDECSGFSKWWERVDIVSVEARV